MDEIKDFKKEEFAKIIKIIKKEIRSKALEDLKKDQIRHSKMSSLVYEDLNIKKYFLDERVESWVAKDIFKFRTRMADVNENFKNNFKYEGVCPLCKISQDNQSHLLICPKLRDVNPTLNVKRNYMDIFSNDVLKVYECTRILIEALQTRKNILIQD